MKLNKISKGVFTCILAGTITLGVSACNRPEEKREAVEQKPVKEYSIEKLVVDCRLDLSPTSKTGQTLEVYARVLEIGNNYKWDVKEKRLYEDGRLIEVEKGSDKSIESIYTTVTHKEQGTHSYHAEFVYNNGYVQKTETKSAEFTGKILDLPPSLAEISVYDNKLYLQARDEGDNKEIVSIKVYEDDKLWKELKFLPDYSVTETVPLDLTKSGKHTYKAEFTDKGGNSVETETIVINYE
ncbi:hypothetical protein FJZ53_05795 [Candidatus Woesearchaeota archaeon]|nr:hypothetical protein [Candidatus Woesearchaeota archaeon]